MTTFKVNAIKTKDFTYKDLSVYHDDCGGGKIQIRPPEESIIISVPTLISSVERKSEPDPNFLFTCKRCLTKISVPTTTFAELCKTALDGKTRNTGYITITI
jgi:hypothetical protein